MRKYILLFIASSVVIAITGLMTILNWPELILNRTVMERVASYAAHAGIDITWKQADISSTSIGFLDKKISVFFSDLCIKAPPSIERLCSEEVKLGFRYSFRNIVPKLVEVGPIDIEGGNLEYNLERTAGDKRDSYPVPKISLPFWLKNSAFFPVNIALNKITIRQKDLDYSGKLSLNTGPTVENKLETVKIAAFFEERNSGMSADIKTTFTSPSHFFKDDWQLNGKIEAMPHKGESASLDINIMKTDNTLENRIKASFIKRDISIEMFADGMVEAKKLKQKLSGNIRLSDNPLKKMDIADCVLKLGQETSGFNRGMLDLACPVNVVFKIKNLPPDLYKISEIPDKVSLVLNAHLKTFLFPDLSQPTEGSLNVEMTPIRNKMATASGHIDSNFSGILSHAPREWSISSRLGLKLTIEEFARLKEALKESAFAVPTPFASLNGSVSLSIEGNVPSLTHISTFPISLQTQLSSPKEDLNVIANGEVTVLDTANIDMDVRLQDVKIELPNISSTEIPRFLPDTRIATKSAGPSNKLKIRYNIRVNTSENQPVLFVSNFAPDPIPLNVNLQLSNDGIKGDLLITRTPLNLFRRDAIIKSFALKFSDPLSESEVNGLLKVSYVDYTISVTLLGTVEKPRVLFESNPPMSQDDIIATLIYGEPFEKLDTDNASSVGNMSAAIADRALSLGSLYVLASTPIRRIGYDPITKTFSAKLKLGKKTSLTVGSSGAASQQIGIQKNLGKGWNINSSIETLSGNTINRAAAFIEWHKRY